MTAQGVVSTQRAGWLGEPRLLRGLEPSGAVPLGSHRATHGPLPQLDLRPLVGYAEAVDLRGRGGAAFPVAAKLRALRRGRACVVVNASESEPASLKDRTLLSRAPHLVLDGAELVARAVGAREVTIAVHGGDVAGLPVHGALHQAIGERSEVITFRVRDVPGGFVSGEARAVVRHLDGGPALPLGRRVLPTHRGLGGAPTFLSNVETFAQLAVLARLGPGGFAAVGTRSEPGTTLLTLGGALDRPGVLEVPLGVPLTDVLAAAGARRPQAVAVGGYHGAWVNAGRPVALSRAGLQAGGAGLGAGVVLVLDENTCGLGELARVAAYLARQSAGQCGPCVNGLPALAADLADLVAGHPRAEVGLTRHLGLLPGRGACAHPDGAARFVRTGLAVLSREVELHRRRGGCGRPVLGQLPVGGRP